MPRLQVKIPAIRPQLHTKTSTIAREIIPCYFQNSVEPQCMASGAIAVLAFSPFGYWPLVIPSLLGLYALLDKATPKQAAWRGFGYAMGLFLPGLWWIHVSMTEFGGIPLPVAFVLLAGLSAYLALYPTLACWIFARFFGGRHWSRWLLAFPALWLVADWLRAG